MDKIAVSCFLCRVLRHNPSAAGIAVDEHGWANVDELIEGVRQVKEPAFDRAVLEDIVATDNKQRYSFSKDGRLIRANQGHSIPVDVELPVVEPPEYLLHGTGEKYTESIDRTGLQRRSRLYVHLSADMETARAVGIRHGKPVIYRVSSGEMARRGYTFYRSVNGVWLVKEVPLEYLQKLDC